MRARALVVLLAIYTSWLFISGCGGGAATPPPVAPQIVTPPSSQTVTAGQPATFSVTAAGTAPLSYQWNKNGTAISGAISATYTTPLTTAADNGAMFNVVVSNAKGSVASTAATLTVQGSGGGAPSIAVQPANQTVTAGQSATFSVTATGTPPLTYQWNKNGAAISGATSAGYTTPPTTSADNGTQFDVVVSDAAGNVTSNPATLTVQASAVAPAITTQPASQTVTAGQTASFSVTATGTSPLSYQWNKNSAAISGATSAAYTTPATTSADNGAQFDVVVSNSAGSVASTSATLIVTSASTVQITTTSLPNGTVQTAYTATLQVTGGTTPYTWSVASGTLPAGLNLAGSTGIMSGTPTTAGTSTFTIQVADSASNKASAGFSITINSGTGGTMPAFGHVIIVIGENSAYSQTFSATTMPYLTSLANKYGLATKYWADTHPSIGNYEGLTAGQIFTNDDAQTPSTLPLSSDNIAFEVQQAGKTWKDYVENLPSISTCGGLNGSNADYIVRHDPLEYFTNVNTQTANYVCFSQFATDLANTALPNLSWLSPNGCDDGHNSPCSISTFDSWLQTEIAPLLASSYFQTGGDGLLIITVDEDDGSGSPNCSATAVGQGCGGQVETVVISAISKLGYQSTAGDPANFNTTYDEASILRTIADALGVKNSGLGGAATRVPMADFFQ